MSVKVNVDTKVRLTSTGQTTFVKKVVMGTPVRSTVEDPGLITGLSDVTVSNPTNDQILIFDSSTSSFVNKDSASLTNLRITNNLIVEGTTTSINTTNLDIEDHNITLAKGIFTNEDADGAGITIDFVNAKIAYDLAANQWNLNRGINVTGNSVITGNLLPGADSTHDLGDSNTKWKDLYLSGSTIHLGDLDIKNQNGGFAVLDSTGSAVGYDLSGSAAAIRGFFSSGGDLSYDSSTGRFSFDVEQVYTKANFDSDFDDALDEAALGGIGLTFNSATNTLSIDSSELSANFRQDIRSYISATDGGGDGSFSYNSGTGVFTYTGPSASEVRSHFSAQGDLSYDSTTGVFQFDVEQVYTKANFDSDLGAALDGGTGITYDSSSDTISITNTGVTAATYGSASTVPQIAVNAQGQITSATNVNIAGVTGVTYDSSNGAFSVSTSDGSTFTDSINLNPFSTTDLSEGTNLYFTTARADSDAKNAISGGAGITYTSGTGVIDITNTTVNPAVYGSASLVPVLTINSRGQIDSAGTVSVAGVSGFTWDSSTGQAIITTADGGSFPATIKGFKDNQKLNFGDDNDLQIYHDGANSYIADEGTGNLNIKSTYANIFGAGGTSATFYPGNAVDLYYNNTKRFETTDSGILVSGSILADSAHLTSINFATNTGPPNYGEGVLWYDNTYHTLNYYGDDSTVIHNLGLEEHQRVFNDTGSTIAKGAPLYFSGNYSSGSFDVPTVGLADATDVNAYNAQGLAASDIPHNSYGYCLIAGQLFNVNTSALSAGANFFVGLGPGLVQNASPLYPNFPMCLGWVVSSHATNGVLLVNQQNHSVNSFRVRTSAHIGTDLQVDGNLTVLGTQTTVGQSNVTQGAPFYRLNEGDAIGEANTTFTGSGLDDAFFAGHFKGTTSQTYYVRIDGKGTGPGGVDTFEVALGDDSTFTSPFIIKEPITGNPQLIHSIDNISVEFGSTTGHDSGDRWSGTASPINVDTGFFTNRNTGTTGVGYTHMGFYFDVSDDKWKVIDEYDSTPTGVINVTDSALGILVATTFEGDLSGTFDGISSGSFLRSDAADNKTSGDLTFNDGVKAVFGNGSDLQISHTGAASLIEEAGTGSLVMRTNNLIQLDTQFGSEVMAKFIKDGAAELYYNGLRKVMTDSDGMRVMGIINQPSGIILEDPSNTAYGGHITFYDGTSTEHFGNGEVVIGGRNNNNRLKHIVLDRDDTKVRFTGDVQFDSAGAVLFDRSEQTLKFGDGRKATFGTGDDLSILHLNGNSILRENNGNQLYLQTNNTIHLTKNFGSEHMAKFIGDGAVELYHNNNKKLETTIYGSTITGTVNADSGTFDKLHINATTAAPGRKTLEVRTNSSDTSTITGKGLSGGTTGSGVLLHNTNTTGGSYANLDFRASNADARIAVKFEKANTGNMRFILDRDGILRKSVQLDSSVQLFHATNSSQELKFQTTDSGVSSLGNITVNGNALEIGNQVFSGSTYHGLRTGFMTGGSDFMIISGETDGNTYISAKSGSSVLIRGGANTSASQLEVFDTAARAYGDFQFDSAGAVFFDKSDQSLKFGLNYKAKFGSSSDMEIYHNQFNDGVIDNNTGRLVYQAQGHLFRDQTGGEIHAQFNDNGSVELYYDNSKKFETTTNGVYLDGRITYGGHIDIEHDSSRLTSTSQTAITSFSSTTYTGGKFIITAHDHAAGSRQISELLVLRDSAAGTAYATEYGHIQTGTEIATYDVDINGGNIRVLATSSSTNPTTYQVAETLMRE